MDATVHVVAERFAFPYTAVTEYVLTLLHLQHRPSIPTSSHSPPHTLAKNVVDRSLMVTERLDMITKVVRIMDKSTERQHWQSLSGNVVE